MVILSLLFFCAALMILSVAGQLWVFILGAVFSGFGIGNIFPIMQFLALKDVAANRRGAATSTFFNSFDLGIGIGAPLWGVVSQYTGYTAMYLIAVIPASAAVIFYSKGRVAK